MHIGPTRTQQVATVATMYVGYAAFMVLRTIPGTVATSLQSDPSTGVDVEIWGRIMAAGTCGGIVGKLAGGLLADKLGGKTTFAGGLLLTSVFIGLFAMAGSPWFFAAAFFFALMAKSSGWPAMAKIITRWFPSHEYGSVWGIISTSSRVGTIIASLALGAMLTDTVGSWRMVLGVASAIGGVCTLVFVFTLREAPNVEPAELTADDVSKKPNTPHVLDGTTLGAAVLSFFRSPQFWLITASMMGLSILWDFLGFLPNFLKESFGFDDAKAAMAPSAFPMGSLISVLCGGFIFDKISRAKMAVVMGLLLAIAGGCLGAFYVMSTKGLTPEAALPYCVGLLFVFGLCVSPCYYIPMSVFSIEFGGPHSGFLISLLDVFGFAAFAVFSFFGGTIAKNYGWSTFMIVLIGISVWSLLATVLFLLGEANRQRKPGEAT